MNKQDILNAFREMRRLNGYASIWKYHPMGVARDIDQWLLTTLTEFEREIYKEIREKIYKVYDEKYSHLTRDYRAEDEFRDDICGTNGLLSQLEKEKHT